MYEIQQFLLCGTSMPKHSSRGRFMKRVGDASGQSQALAKMRAKQGQRPSTLAKYRMAMQENAHTGSVTFLHDIVPQEAHTSSDRVFLWFLLFCRPLLVLRSQIRPVPLYRSSFAQSNTVGATCIGRL